MTGRTIIVGGTHRDAVGWCKANGVQPYARTTRILLTPDAVHGLVITPEDHVVWHEDTSPALRDAVRIAMLTGGARR